MAGTTLSQEIFNTREEVVSDDLMRLQRLASRDLQDIMQGQSEAFSGTDSATALGSNMLNGNGTPIYGVNVAPSVTSPSGYTLTIGAGSGFLYYTPGTGGDFSSYQVVRWPSSVATYATPHASLPRIDLVSATLGTVNTDASVRNILIDPAARTVAAQSVNKTANPTATIVVTSGTAASVPKPPAAPAGSLPLIYTYVPAAAASAANFENTRASWPRAPYPLTTMNGVLGGCGLIWNLLQNPATTHCGISMFGRHRIVIDGEVMDFYADISDTDADGGSFVVDTSNNPFGSAAPATNSRPYYIYACGGRHNPLPHVTGFAGAGLCPVTICESKTPPNLHTGRPTAALTVNGVTVNPVGATYIGFGMTYTNTTNRLAMLMDDEMTLSPVRLEVSTINFASSGFVKYPDFASAPVTARRARINFSYVTANSGSARSLNIYMDDGTGTVGPAASAIVGTSDSMAGVNQQAINTSRLYNNVTVHWPTAGIPVVWGKIGTADSDSSQIAVVGYNHNVNQLKQSYDLA